LPDGTISLFFSDIPKAANVGKPPAEAIDHAAGRLIGLGNLDSRRDRFVRRRAEVRRVGASSSSTSCVSRGSSRKCGVRSPELPFRLTAVAPSPPRP
jgi:hypothetical protein